MTNLDKTLRKALKDKPNIIILNGDFNARSPFIWHNETTQNAEGKALAEFCIKNSLEQVIDEATHLPNDHTQTCIDLIMTNQPFLFVDKGVIPSPDPSLKHQIIHGKLNFCIPSPPPYKRKIWNFKLANIPTIKLQMNSIPWEQFMLNNTLDDCVKFFTTNFLNIMQANIPNKIATFDDRDAPWVTPPLKNLLRKDRKIYSDWTKNSRNPTDLDRIKQHQLKTQKAIQEAKDHYFADLSDKLCNPTTGQKTFWSAYKRLSNKKKITNTPPPWKNIFSRIL